MEKINKMERSKHEQNIIRIVKGSLFAIILTFIFLFIFATILTYSNIPESTITPIVIIITAISILIGSAKSTRNINKNAYDRHFAITEEFGFELVSVPMTPNGPDMDIVEKLVAEDPDIKGIWCVPQYSNPDGYTYSDETIERFAKMKTAAPDFKIFWDEAYIVHHLTDEIIETPVLLNESKKYGNENRVFMFTSTSKITFPGAGVSAIACSESSMKYICKRFSVMIISYDKMNQLRHVRFLKNKEGVLAHMAKHRRRLVPCFDAVKTAFKNNLIPCGDIAHWTDPKGGYFISLYVMPGCAKRVAGLCKDAGLTLTGAGSAYPYHKDPEDSHLRIAPTYPSLDEVETASELLCICVRLAVAEKLLADKAD